MGRFQVPVSEGNIMVQAKRSLLVGFLTLTAIPLTNGAGPEGATPESGRSKTPPEKLTYELDQTHSSVAFRIKHSNIGYVYGLFQLGGGRFHLDPENLAGSFVEASVKADSINTNHAGRDDHLKGADFFDVEKYTEISFKSTKISYLGEGKFSVDGNLTFLGVTRPLQAGVIDMGATWSDRGSGYQRGMTTTITVDRTKFGMKSVPSLGDEVEIFISLTGGADPDKK